MSADARFAYAGPAGLLAHIETALRRVVDPEMAVNIVDLGLVYGVEAGDGRVRACITMTSAACPVIELIVEDTQRQLERALPGMPIRVDVVWEPPWGPERLGPRAREALGWEA